MDQQNNRAVPDEPAQGGQPHQAGTAAEGQARPQSQWEVFAGNPDSPQAPSGWAPPRIAESRPSQDWAAPGSGQPAGWGSTTADTDQRQEQPAGWGAPQPYPAEGPPRALDSGALDGRTLDNRGRAARKGLIIGGVVVAVAAAAGAGAYAAGNSSVAAADNTQDAGGASGTNGQADPGGQFAPGGQSGMTAPDGIGGMNGGAMGGPGGLGIGLAGLNAAIHSEYVILQDSSYVTMASQTGTVTDVSSDWLTVKSEDGFSRIYAVGADVQVSEGIRQRGGGSTGGTLGISEVTSGSTVRVTALKSSDSYTAQAILLAPAPGTAAAPGAGSTSN